MTKLSCMTPNGQVTIPHSIMKNLGIGGGSDILIEIENGQLVLKKVENNDEENENSLVYNAG